MVALFFHFSLSILGNTILSWASSAMTQYVLISFGRPIGRWMTNGKLWYHCIAEPLQDLFFHTKKQQILTNESASFSEVLHSWSFLGRARMRDQGADHTSAQRPGQQGMHCSCLSTKVDFLLMGKRNVPGRLKFLHSYILQVLKRRQESTTRLKLQGICT